MFAVVERRQPRANGPGKKIGRRILLFSSGPSGAGLCRKAGNFVGRKGPRVNLHFVDIAIKCTGHFLEINFAPNNNRTFFSLLVQSEFSRPGELADHLAVDIETHHSRIGIIRAGHMHPFVYLWRFILVDAPVQIYLSAVRLSVVHQAYMPLVLKRAIVGSSVVQWPIPQIEKVWMQLLSPLTLYDRDIWRS